MKKSTIIWIIGIAAAAAVAVILILMPKNTQEIPAEAAASTPPVVAESALSSAPATPSPSPTPSKIDASATTPVEFEDSTIEYEYFDVVENTTKPVSTQVSEKEPLMYPFEIVAQQIFGKPLAETPIVPNSVELREGNLYIDLKKDITTANLGSSGESTVLESLADSYLNNLAGVNAVYISLDGNDYSSSHLEFPKDQPYKTK